MNATQLIEEITLVAEAGDASDALDLVRQLTRAGHTEYAIEARRAVNSGQLDRNALLTLASGITQRAAAYEGMFTPEVIEGLYDLEARMREAVRTEAATTAAERRARSAAIWTGGQRYDERVNAYNAQVEKVNRERGREANEREAAAVRKATCEGCWQVKAANGSCGC